MNELLRFTSGSSIGVSLIFPSKKEFVFYENKLDVYNKGKLIKTVNYEDIIEVAIMKTWQNNVFINVKPIGFNIYKVPDEICTIIKHIIETSKMVYNTEQENENR